MSRLSPARVRANTAVLLARASDDDGPRLWRSVEQALAFYFLWGPRLLCPRNRGVWSPEELEAMQLDGSPARGEDMRLDVADIAKCLMGLTDEESLALRVTFGLTPGARREVRGGIAVYIDNETESLVMGDDASVAPASKKSRAYDSAAPSSERLRPRAARSFARRSRGELSWKDAARRMGWVADSGEADHKRVQRRVASARAKIRDVMVDRGMLVPA